MPKPRQPKNTKARNDDDDSSVDSKGNIKDLIDYDYDDVIMAEPGIALRRVPPRAVKEKRKTKSVGKAPAPAAPAPAPAPAAPAATATSRTKYERAAKNDANNVIKMLLALHQADMEAADDETDDEYIDKAEKMLIEDDGTEEEAEEEADDTDDDDYEEDAEDEDEDIEIADSDGLQSLFGSKIKIIVNDGKTPQRHNMKKEPEIVRDFVNLITAPMEDNNIDTQIDQFKSLPVEKQQQIIHTLKARPTAADVANSLMFKILDMKLPSETQNYILGKYQTLEGMDPNTSEYFKTRNWLDKVSAVPFGKYREMPVRLTDGPENCHAFMENARKILDTATFGQTEAKLQILQFIAAKISNPSADGISLLLIGPPGVGKTTIIKNGIAKALQWPFQFISLGGETDASTYTGHQLVYEGSHAGKIVNSLITAKSLSLVMMFDELDKISKTPKGEEIQHMLIHLTDPVQNMCFEDKYLANIPIDLGKSMFVFSGNDINKIDKVLLDRMRVVELKAYTTDEKIKIAENFLIPETLAQVNLSEKVCIGTDVIRHIIDTYAKEEAGVRELRRCIEQIAQKVNMLRMYNTKDLSFHIPEFQLPFIVKKSHVELFLKRKETGADTSYLAMYI